jgi:hypothetical protein
MQHSAADGTKFMHWTAIAPQDEQPCFGKIDASIDAGLKVRDPVY